MKKVLLFINIILIFILTSCWMVSEGEIIGGSTSSKYGIEFNDMLYQLDGFEKELVISGELPTGFSVKYFNNVGKNVGNYYATCEIYDNNNELVETHKATLIIENRESYSFNAFLDQFLSWYVGEDQFAINIFFESPAEFNLDHYDAKWYSYDEEYTDDMLKQYQQSFKQMYDSLEDFNGKLSRNQTVAYNTIRNFIGYYKDLYSISNVPYLSNRYIDQFGGYVSNFISSIESYNIRTEQDAIDMINLIKSTEEAFLSYIDFADDKAKKGFAYSDYTLNGMIDYLEDLLNNKKDFYLINTLKNKIYNSGISSSKHKLYVDSLTEAINVNFFNGVEGLINDLKPFIGKLSTENEGYLTKYTDGQKYYKLELSNLLGINNIDIEKYMNIINEEFEETNDLYNNELNKLVNTYNVSSSSDIDELIKSELIIDGSIDEMLNYLKAFSKKIVPELTNEPNIIVDQMDDATSKVSNAVAYYTKSSIDSTATEKITLNPLYLDNKNIVLSTLAHEGYPGHLYSYCYMKELDIHPLMKIMTSTAHAEGWATYVELALYDDISNSTNNQKLKDICDYLYAEQLNSFLLETKIDLELHINKWSYNDLYQYLKDNGYNYNNTSYIYNRMIELPVSYNAYSFGKLMFNQLHENAKEILKDVYNEVEFNTMLLSNGWVGLDELLNIYNEYMLIKCHKYNIEFETIKSIYLI